MNSLALLIASFLIPDEFSFEVGGLLINAYRVVLIAVFPSLLWGMFHKVNEIQWNRCDAIALLLSIWPTIAFSVNTSITAGIESGGVLALEMIAPYLLIRLNVTTYQDRKKLATYLLAMVAVLFFLGLPDAIWGRHFIHEIASQMIGTTHDGTPLKRLGIWRAKGPTDHAILFGTLCVSAMILAITLAFRQKRYWVLALFSAAGAVISASSAPILSMIVQLSMLGWATLFRGYKYKWWWLFALIFGIYITIDVLSNRDPIRVMFSYLLLNSQTGYTRYYMWTNSLHIISQTPIGMIFGHGYDSSIFDLLDSSYWRTLMTATVDSYWLVLMLRYGVTMIALFAVFVILVLRKALTSSRNLSKSKDRRLMNAYFIAAFTLTLIATTVHFWEEMTCVYMMIMAVCVSGVSRRRKDMKPRSNLRSVTFRNKARRHRRENQSKKKNSDHTQTLSFRGVEGNLEQTKSRFP